MLRLLNPLLLIPTAVFEKEVRVQGRRWGTYLARATYASLLLGLISIIFTVFSSEIRNQSGARALQDLQTLAPGLTVAVLWFQFIALTLFSPTILGPSICDENRSGTLATLLTTPLTAAQIVLGKLAGGLVQIFILALISTPMLLVIRVFGGVQASTIFAGLSIGLSTAILAACLALNVSVTAKRGTTAAVAGLSLAIAFHAIPAIVMGLMRGKMGILVPNELIYGSSSPCQMFLVTVELISGGPGFPFRMEWLWAWNSLYSLSIAALAIVVATARLRQVMVLAGAGAPATPSLARRVVPTPDTRAAAPPTAPGAIAIPVRRPEPLERAARDVGDKPVLWREVRQPIFRRKWQLPALVLAVGALMVWIYSEVGVKDREIFIVIAAIGMVVAMLLAASTPVAAITGEREARTWETLLTTSLSPREVLLGKVAGALKRQWVLPAMLGANFLLAGILTGALHPLFLFHFTLLLAAPMVFLACTGVLASLIAKRSVQAAIMNVGLAMLVWLGPPVLYAIFESFGRGSMRGARNIFEFLMMVTNPVPMAVTAAYGAGSHETVRNQGALLYNIADLKGLGVASFTAIVLVHAAIYLAAGMAALAVAARFFRRSGARST